MAPLVHAPVTWIDDIIIEAIAPAMLEYTPPPKPHNPNPATIYFDTLNLLTQVQTSVMITQ
jgi:hypothetical protein